ncbi:MAG: ABC transporter permease, partial [Hyphomicrobiaceae bacterium]
MPTTSEVAVAADIEELTAKRSFWQSLMRTARKQPVGAVGAVLVLLMVIAAVFAPVLSSYDPTANNFADMHQPPSWEHLLGTDQFGRDIFARILYGARTALFVGFAASFFGGGVGLVLGVSSAYFGGRFDLIFQRVM